MHIIAVTGETTTHACITGPNFALVNTNILFDEIHQCIANAITRQKRSYKFTTRVRDHNIIVRNTIKCKDCIIHNYFEFIIVV